MTAPPRNNKPAAIPRAAAQLARSLLPEPEPTMDEGRGSALQEPWLGEPPDDIIGPVPTRRVAREWGLVLQSMSIAFVIQLHADGWVLRVSPALRAQALEAIEAYEEENVDWPPPKKTDQPRHAPSAVVPLAFAALAMFFGMTTGPVSAGSAWFAQGRADASLLFAEPWRMVTALTLHADGKHVLGNLISGGIFGAAVSRRLGPGVALFAILAAGAMGNTANALYHLQDGHRSIGASTAVFGAVGLLATIQVMLLEKDRLRPRQRRIIEFLGPIIGGLALLGALGASPHSDLWAHGFGFAAGALLGLVAGLFERRRKHQQASLAVQLALGTCALLVVVGSWQLAMM